MSLMTSARALSKLDLSTQSARAPQVRGTAASLGLFSSSQPFKTARTNILFGYVSRQSPVLSSMCAKASQHCCSHEVIDSMIRRSVPSFFFRAVNSLMVGLSATCIKSKRNIVQLILTIKLAFFEYVVCGLLCLSTKLKFRPHYVIIFTLEWKGYWEIYPPLRI